MCVNNCRAKSGSFFYQRAAAAAELSVLSCSKDWHSLALSLLRVSVSFYIAFWRASLLLRLNRRRQSIICEWKKRTQTLSLILSPTVFTHSVASSPFPISHISLPTALEKVRLNSSLPPSSQLSLSMINVLLCYLGKENPLHLMRSAVKLTWQKSSYHRQFSYSAGSTPHWHRQTLLAFFISKKINSWAKQCESPVPVLRV